MNYILLLDDEQHWLDNFTRATEAVLPEPKTEWQILTAQNGDELLRLLDDKQKETKLIISDLNLREGYAWDVLEKIRTQYPHIKLLLSTRTSAQYLDQEAYNRCKIDSYLNKYDFEEKLLDTLVELGII